jgi:hypothetical protein
MTKNYFVLVSVTVNITNCTCFHCENVDKARALLFSSGIK